MTEVHELASELNLPMNVAATTNEFRDQLSRVPTAFHVMTKPIGAVCNLDCKYCFYLEKEHLYQKNNSRRMPHEILELYIRQYIESQRTEVVTFAWQGGEPTLLGVDYFRGVVELEKKHAGGKRIKNALQTNGTLLDDRWCEFLFYKPVSDIKSNIRFNRYQVTNGGRLGTGQGLHY